MVRGLDIFRDHFASHVDQFVLIGGTAATLAMEQVGLPFRATKDLLLSPETHWEVAPRIARDLDRFLDGIDVDSTIDPSSIGISGSLTEVARRIAEAYRLHRPKSL